MDAARLLLAADDTEASLLAATLESANLVRRDLTKTVIAEARVSPDAVDDAAATILRGPWPVGIIGLVASRLADERGRPAVVGADLGALVRASCRSDGRVHLADALAACGDILIRHGGHAGAAGFEIRTEDWDAFRARFVAIVEAGGPVDPRPSLTLDLALAARDVDYGLHRELARLAPCGIGNAEPLVAVLGLTVTRVREASGGHTQLVLRRERDVLDGIAFGWPELATLVQKAIGSTSWPASPAAGSAVSSRSSWRSATPRRRATIPRRGPSSSGGPWRLARASPPSSCPRSDGHRQPPPIRRERGFTESADRAPGGRRARPRARRPGHHRGAERLAPDRHAAHVPGSGPGGAVRTPTPSGVVITDPRANVPGTVVYAKDGNIWLQTGTKATQLTTSGFDSMPAWSADGKWVYFIRSIERIWPLAGQRRPSAVRAQHPVPGADPS